MWIALQQFQPAGPLEGAYRSTRPGIPSITKTKHQINTTTKKKLIIAAVVVAITATSAHA